ncbi:MAG: hypothetical protein N2690_06995, partial [Rhodocyclaceae bacterium]|nr:hypothetical protein [Rhodocyclaceae bacterium]
HAQELADWTGHVMQTIGIAESGNEARYRIAACLLADIGWRAHPDYRGAQSLNIIAHGAFVGIDAILADTHAYGYIATDAGEDQKVLDRLNARVKPTDLNRFGLIPEFAGRLPIVARLTPLSKAMLVRIQTEPQNALYKQFKAIFAGLGVELVIAPAVFEEIAELAIEYRAGARSLRGIFEEMLTPALYLVPDHPEVKRVVIDSLFEKPRYLGAAA